MLNRLLFLAWLLDRTSEHLWWHDRLTGSLWHNCQLPASLPDRTPGHLWWHNANWQTTVYVVASTSRNQLAIAKRYPEEMGL